MITQNNKSILQKQDHQLAQGKKALFVGGLIVLLIAISPFIFYIYKGFPDTSIWETSFFKLNTAYGSWVNTIWYISGKVVPIYLLLIWFFTCKHWWHWIILVPITMYIFQLWNIWNGVKSLDEIEIFWMLPVLMVLVPSVYLIRAKLFNSVRGDNLKSFEEELGQNQTLWRQIKDLFR